MTTNRQELEDLLTTGRIRMQAGDLLNSDPAPLPTDFDFARVSGMMLGLDIGDALGNTTESMLPAERASRGRSGTAWSIHGLAIAGATLRTTASWPSGPWSN
jgi:hypothetical protein